MYATISPESSHIDISINILQCRSLKISDIMSERSYVHSCPLIVRKITSPRREENGRLRTFTVKENAKLNYELMLQHCAVIKCLNMYVSKRVNIATYFKP
jgi:hypothetical protein